MKRVGLWEAIGVGLFMTVGLITVKHGYTEERGQAPTCNLATLTGAYVFNATGYNIVSSVLQPKAIVEVIDFNGDGTLTVPAATVCLNGVIRRTVDGSGEYMVNEDCTGALTFLPNGPHFDIFSTPDGKQCNMIQTDADTVLAGVARKVAHAHEERDREERDGHHR
jgi:hypothetical protein